MSSCEKHQHYLDSHCRVCGKAFGKHTKYLCINSLTTLEALGIDTTNDQENIHPNSFCNSCYLISKHVSHSSSTRPKIMWSKHDDNHCTVCDVMCKGGRRRKTTSSGRPTLLTQHIRSVACHFPPFTLHQIIDQTYSCSVTCIICNLAINNPVEILPCKTMVCCNCLISHFDQKIDQFQCPGCNECHDSNASSFTKISPVAEQMIGNILLNCKECHRPVKLKDLCKECSHHDTSSAALIDTRHLSIDTQPTTVEKQVATNVVTRLLHQSNGAVVSLPTGGLVSVIK